MVMDAHTGGLLRGRASIAQSLRDILTTPLGSRVMRADYGSRLWEYLDQPMTPALRLSLYRATAEAIGRWEPRFALAQVAVTLSPPGGLTFALHGTVRPAQGEPKQDIQQTVTVEVNR